MEYLFWLLNAATIVLVYVLWIRPTLQKTPALGSLFASEETRLAAVRKKFAGIKQRLTAGLVYLAGTVVVMYDTVAPQITGIDVTPLTTKVSAHVPQWSWPLIAIAFTALLDYFRTLSDKRSDR